MSIIIEVVETIVTSAVGVENISLIPNHPIVVISLVIGSIVWKFESACEGFVKAAQQVEKMVSKTVKFFGWKPRRSQLEKKKCKKRK